MSDLKDKLDQADEALMNLDADLGEAFESAINAARSAINAARALVVENSWPAAHS